LLGLDAKYEVKILIRKSKLLPVFRVDLRMGITAVLVTNPSISNSRGKLEMVQNSSISK